MADATQSTELARLEPEQRAPARQASHDAVAAFDTAKFDQMVRVARGMALAPTLPDHLKGKTYDDAVGNCLAIVEQSHRWGMSPFAVASATYFVHGKIGYEGKLVAAALANLTGIKLNHEFSGKVGAADRAITVYDPADPTRRLTGTVAQWQTRDKQGQINRQWQVQPDDQLIYRGTRQWCRRYEPGVILGVYTPDELEAGIDEPRDITPPNGGPPPAPPRKQVTPPAEAAKEPADEPFADPAGYLTHLEEEMVVAADAALLDEVWQAHLASSDGRLSREHQERAEVMYRKYAKQIAVRAKAAKDAKPAERDTLDLGM